MPFNIETTMNARLLVLLLSLRYPVTTCFTSPFTTSSTARQQPKTQRLNGWFDNFLPKIDDSSESSNERQRLYPEQYPATYELLKPTESSPLTDTDPNVKRIIRPLLKQTQLEQRPLYLVYDAERDGWTASSFHQKVDGKGAAVVLARTAPKDKAFTVGGYNPKGWASLGGARPSVAAFLFYGDDDGSNHAALNLRKLQKVGGGGLACARDEFDFGISFGPDGLVIGLQPGREKVAQSKLGTYYERGEEDLSSLFEKMGGACQLADLKVFVGVYEDNEEIPYSGAVFDMTSG